MIICKRPVPWDEHLQEASFSRWLFARGRPLRMIICTRPAPPDHHLKEPGPSGWSFTRGQQQQHHPFIVPHYRHTSENCKLCKFHQFYNVASNFICDFLQMTIMLWYVTYISYIYQLRWLMCYELSQSFVSPFVEVLFDIDNKNLPKRGEERLNCL